MMPSEERILDELNDVLEAERSALLDGRLDAVDRLFARKTSLVDRVGELDARPPEAFESIRKKLEANQVLLKAAAEGIRSISRRLVAIRRVKTSLETYDAKGQRTIVEVVPGSTLEKRA